MTSIIEPPDEREFEGGEKKRPPPPWLVRLDALGARTWFAYLTIFLLQLRVMWNVWRYRDLTRGDTSQYFAFGWEWYSQKLIHLAMSPLYSIFYGTFLWFTSDAYTATIAHRMVIVMCGTLMVLAVMRRLLPAGVAWVVTAWWAILPVNFNALYEVHQFAMLPILLAWLVALGPKQDSWTRAIVLGIFVAATIFVRNEMIVVVVIFAAFCVWAEWRQRRAYGLLWHGETTVLKYLIPLIVLFPVVRWCLRHSDESLEQLRTEMVDKHTLNMAQAFAYGYQQRHPEWDHSPWIDSAILCKKEFGDPQPSLLTMLDRNPDAMAAHFAWNLRLLPAGLQLMLFSSTSGGLNPDYEPVNMHSSTAFLGSAVVAAIVLIALMIWWLEHEKWRGWFSDARVGWEAMIAVALLAPLIVLTQRPRPEYLYGLSLFVMAVVGTAGWIIVSRLPKVPWIGAIMAVVMVAPLFVVHSDYHQIYPERTVVWQVYERLKPYQPAIEDPKNVFVDGAYAQDMVCYIGHGLGKALSYGDGFADWQSGESLAQFLDRHEAGLCYLDDKTFQIEEPGHPNFLPEFFAEAGLDGWRMVGHEQLESGWWMLMQKMDDSHRGLVVLPRFDQFTGWENPQNILPPEGPYRYENVPRVQWALFPDASITIRAPRAGKYQITISAQSPADQSMRGSLDGVPVLLHHFTEMGPFESANEELNIEAGVHELKFDFGKFIQHEHNGPRLALMFRELRIEPVVPTTMPAAAVMRTGIPTTMPTAR